MSCTLMYQPYAMSYSSSCERPSASAERQKLFKFPHIPSPPDSSHSGASSYSGHSSASSTPVTLPLGSSTLPLSLSTPNHHHHHHSPGGRSSTSRRPLTPSSTGPSATITSSHLQQQSHQHGHHITHNHSTGSNSTSSSRTASSNHPSASVTSQSHHPGGGGSELQHHGSSSAGSSGTGASSASTSHIHHETTHNSSNNQPGPSGSSTGGGGNSGGGARAQYLSANCVVYESYDGETARVVDEHFSRALSAAYTSDKPSKGLPMTTRNFPPSFWNSAYQPPPKPLTGYGATGATDFYGSAMDYGSALPALAHHHQTDPWHYPLTPHHHHHQPYHHHHHRAADLAYPPIPSTSRFNPAQYGSFLFPGAAATASAAAVAGRFAGIPGPSQCGVKGDTGGHWGAGGRYHPHESTWSDFHLADYSAAAAHYSNMTAGLDFESHYLQSS